MTSGLAEYIRHKRKKLDEQSRRPAAPAKLAARVVAEGRSGVRRIFIRDFQIITDGAEAGGGFNLGPAPGELLLGSIAACLNHGFLIQAALLEIDLDSVEVIVEAAPPPNLIGTGETTPVQLGLQYKAKIASSAPDERIEELKHKVELNSFVYNIVTRGAPISGQIERVAS